MAAVQALIPQSLPPAGDPVVLRAPRPAPPAEAYWPGYRAAFYASGTAALAAAVLAAVRVTGKARPEVLLPGYGCPDLVSAVLYAGARPVLVDVEPEKPQLALAALSAALSADTAAVVAVHLFGLRERLEPLRAAAESVGAVLIEDSAQAFDPALWNSELVVLSFGRGKPVSLLGGGAVLWRQAELGAALPQPPAGDGRGFALRALPYNLLRRPSLYWLPRSLPGLGLGQTRFRPLTAIEGMDRRRRMLLPLALARYLQRGRCAQWAVRAMLAEVGDGFVDLAERCGEPPTRRLLRYPVLAASAELRQRALAELTRQGLGASAMYGAALVDIPGVAEACGAAVTPAAADLARRLLTLPVHADVRPGHVRRMRQVLLACAQQA